MSANGYLIKKSEITEGGSLEPYPSTPTAKPSERLDSPVATPVSSLKGHLPGLPATPKSVGISGVPRRVPLPPKESSQAAASSGKTPSKAPAKSTARQSRLAVTRKTTGLVCWLYFSHAYWILKPLIGCSAY